MKKKMERLDNELFRPLRPPSRSGSRGGHHPDGGHHLRDRQPNPDFVRDGDHE